MRGALPAGRRAVLDFLVTHSSEYGPASMVCRGQPAEVVFKVPGDLPLRLLDKAERPPVAEDAAGSTNEPCAAEPERREPAGTAIKLREPRFAPEQVITFFASRLAQVAGDVRITRHCGMALVQRLRRHLTGMIDAHEAGSVTAFAGIQFCIGDIGGWIRAGAAGGRSGNSAQRVIDPGQESVDR